MKIEEVKRYSTSIGPTSVFAFVSSSSHYGDILYGGCENGHIFYTPISSMKISQVSSSSDCHRGQVSAIHISYHPKVIHRQQTSPLGIVFTGGRDHVIKVWNPYKSPKTLIQTLLGHDGIITHIVEANDGAIISCSSDGIVKCWSAVSGRTDFLNPYYECIYTYKASGNSWYTCLCVGDIIGPWSCFASDSSGNISEVRKSPAANANSNNELYRHNYYEKVHNLSITSMILIREEDILVTTSSDATCKLTDAKTGSRLISIRNNRMGRYEGIAYASFEKRLYLTDEFGYLEIYSLHKMSILSTLQLYKQTAGEKACTLSCHKFSILGKICKGRDDCFYIHLPYASGVQNKDTCTLYAGEIASWRLHVEHSILYFHGHQCDVVHIAIPYHATDTHRDQLDEISSMKAYRKAAEYSIEESCMITVGSDQVIRRWDEYDCRVVAEIKLSKSIGAVMTCAMIWQLNSIITCHDDGHICIYDVTTGNMMHTKAFNESIQAVTYGRYYHSVGMIVADLSGRIAFIDLIQYEKNPTFLPIEYRQKGFHDPINPGILALSYNHHLNIVFSGGHDNSIRIWKPLSDTSSCIMIHDDAVCFIQSYDSIVLSGDMLGTLYLWELKTHDEDHHNNDDAMILCCWPASDITNTCSSCQFIQASSTSMYAVQANIIDKAIIWSIIWDNNTSSSSVFVDADYKLYSSNIIISRYAEINLENVEVSSTRVSYESVECDGMTMLKLKHLYCGTADGPVLRYDIDSYRI